MSDEKISRYESLVLLKYPTADKHPGWEAFKAQLNKCAPRYGYNVSEVREAWYWFAKGWDGQNTEV